MLCYNSGISSTSANSYIRRMGKLVTAFVQTVRLLAVLLVVLGLSSASPALTLRINGGQLSTNTDTLVELRSRVSFSCNDDTDTPVAGDFFFNDLNATTYPALLSRQTDGSWTIHSMSLEHQGSYKCCVQAWCEEIAVISELDVRLTVGA